MKLLMILAVAAAAPNATLVRTPGGWVPAACVMEVANGARVEGDLLAECAAVQPVTALQHSEQIFITCICQNGPRLAHPNPDLWWWVFHGVPQHTKEVERSLGELGFELCRTVLQLASPATFEALGGLRERSHLIGWPG